MVKRAGKKKKMGSRGRPKGKSPDYIELGLRVTKEDYRLIQRGTDLEAKRLHILVSRNNFCLRAALAAAEKEREIAGESGEVLDSTEPRR